MPAAGTGAPEGRRLLAWFGNPSFAKQMGDHGWRVAVRGHTPGLVYDWNSVLELTGGETPDALVVNDASSPPFVSGMEDFPCLTLFYVIDSHIHSWYPLYAQGFDFCRVTQKEHLASFARGRLDASRVLPLPPFAMDHYLPPEPRPEKRWDLVFAGTVLRERSPRRYDFLNELKGRFPALHITGDRFTGVYPQARLILNECSGGELNFRVFEALGHGGCLLTPDIGPAVRDFFRDGEELFLYPPYDVEAVLALVRRLLADAALRERVAAAGLAAVNARHRSGHRTRDVAGHLNALFASGAVPALVAARRAAAPLIRREYLRPLYLHHAEALDDDRLRRAYLRIAKRA